jgi:RNA polymerase sigma-70 factor (ECF subfamily)
MREGDCERRVRFDALFAAHSADIVAYCSWRAGSTGDAQDAVAEVFLTAWRRLADVPGDEAAKVWLYATARRVIANQRRSNRRRIALQERLAIEAGSTSEEPSADRDEEQLVREAPRRLGPSDREVLLLAEWEGLSPAEIASVMGCLTVTARGRLHRARQRFRTTPSWPAPGDTRFHEGGSMSASESLLALRRANPRANAGFGQLVRSSARSP